MDVLSIPGYAKSVIKERTVRDASFLGITESIGPFEVLPLTLRHYIVLRLVGNPLIRGGTPSPNDVKNLLWLLSPNYTTSGPSRKRFDRRCRRLFYPPRFMALFNTRFSRAWYEMRRTRQLERAARIIDTIRAFVAESMQDRPPTQQTTVYEIDYYSDGAYFCALFGAEFGWSEAQTLDMPLKRLFQYLNVMKVRSGSNIPLCNPSDSVRAEWLRKQRQNGH